MRFSAAFITFETYEKETAPLYDYFKQLGILKELDADKPITEIWENLKKALDARLEAGRRRRAMGLRTSLREYIDGETDESKGDAGEEIGRAHV